MSRQKAALLILDGWGKGNVAKSDAIQSAKTPYMDQLLTQYPQSELITYGKKVGLPDGQMGNSEVGHLNIGAGRVVYQDLARINKSLEDGSLAQHEILTQAVAKSQKEGSSIHLFGLLSDGGVHSHIEHLLGMIDILESNGAQRVFLHAFLDGRDTDPHGGAAYLEQVLTFCQSRSTQLASVIGRYYAMDRDQRWERLKKAYDLLVKGVGKHISDPVSEVKEAYRSGTTDEFMEPMIVPDEQGGVHLLTEGDVAICFNYRTDRPRQITQVLTQRDFPEFEMSKLSLHYITMTRYDASFKNIEVLFEKDNLKNTIGEVLADHGCTQVRIAETEKYPHVTYFLSGGREEAFAGEERIVIPSPKVATYDLQPSMSAVEVTDAIRSFVESNAPDFVCLNYANADMVGHTGVFAAAMSACETVDHCLSILVPFLLEREYAIMIIADHGNSDFMINEDGSPHTAHTTNPVPCVLVSIEAPSLKLKDGKLADVAPTLLGLMGIHLPAEMTGADLIIR